MLLNILNNGIVHRHDDGTTIILRPGKNGGRGVEIDVPQRLADEYRLATGDVVEGTTEPLSYGFEEKKEKELDPDYQYDQPFDLQPLRPPASLPTERLTGVTRINGLSLEEAEDRPFPRTRRSHTERVSPDRHLTLATGPHDVTGRMLDFAAPLGAGILGVIWGEHGTGLTYTLRTVLKGIVTNAPDCVTLVLLLRARSEEITDWRRRFPQAEIIVCPTAVHNHTPEQTLRVARLVWETAQRQTELGRDVVLLVDSLTGLWGTMLEAEEADAQLQADQSQARQLMREWVQKAGCFHGEAPLGGSLGGSLTIIGTVWHQHIDEEAEEERDVHPHLRLLEHLIPDISWRVVLSNPLAQARHFPAINVKECLSYHEDRFLPPTDLDTLIAARNALPDDNLITRSRWIVEAIEETADTNTLYQRLHTLAEGRVGE